MSPAVAIAAAYAVVGGGILLYLRRIRRRLREVEADMQAMDRERPAPAEALTIR